MSLLLYLIPSSRKEQDGCTDAQETGLCSYSICDKELQQTPAGSTTSLRRTESVKYDPDMQPTSRISQDSGVSPEDTALDSPRSDSRSERGTSPDPYNMGAHPYMGRENPLACSVHLNPLAASEALVCDAYTPRYGSSHGSPYPNPPHPPHITSLCRVPSQLRELLGSDSIHAEFNRYAWQAADSDSDSESIAGEASTAWQPMSQPVHQRAPDLVRSGSTARLLIASEQPLQGQGTACPNAQGAAWPSNTAVVQTLLLPVSNTQLPSAQPVGRSSQHARSRSDVHTPCPSLDEAAMHISQQVLCLAVQLAQQSPRSHSLLSKTSQEDYAAVPHQAPSSTDGAAAVLHQHSSHAQSPATSPCKPTPRSEVITSVSTHATLSTDSMGAASQTAVRSVTPALSAPRTSPGHPAAPGVHAFEEPHSPINPGSCAQDSPGLVAPQTPVRASGGQELAAAEGQGVGEGAQLAVASLLQQLSEQVRGAVATCAALEASGAPSVDKVLELLQAAQAVLGQQATSHPNSTPAQ